jgi:hypothetical protein
VLSSITKKGEIESASSPPCGFWCLNDRMIKELMYFAKCQTGKMSYDYVEAIHSSRHTLWSIWLHNLNVIKTRIIPKKRMIWSCMPHGYCHHKIYSRHEDIFIYINTVNKYQCKLSEDTKSCVNHDGNWRRINRDLTAMNHTSEKSKRESWRWGTRCDGEGQVIVWNQDINHAMESHIALRVDIY